MINIGCGNTFHADWDNLDLVSHAPEVRAVDLTRGLPYGDGVADVCYSSHVLEHLRPEEARAFLAEQKRVLKPGGILRIVVPDLEAICRNYIRYLDALTAGDRSAEFRYDFTLLEMYDQTTRDVSGGELGRLYASGNIPDLDYVLSRTGSEVARNLPSAPPSARKSAMEKLRAPGGLGKAVAKARRKLGEIVVGLVVGGRTRQALREGLFRNSGEIHRVMYDRFSLGRLLEASGFGEVTVRGAEDSRIPDFASYGLDAEGGVVRKPDSLFMEAVRAEG